MMAGTTVSANSVLGNVAGSGGGGIFDANTDSTSDSTIAANSSSIDGGGIETYGAHTISLTNVTVYKNTATGNGGNIENGTSATTVLANSIVAGGSAANAPDLHNLATFTDSDYNIFSTA